MILKSIKTVIKKAKQKKNHPISFMDKNNDYTEIIFLGKDNWELHKNTTSLDNKVVYEMSEQELLDVFN